MHKFVLSLLALFLFGCDSGGTHPEIYVYKSQAYTTSEVSDFEVDHYQTFGNRNFLILENEESKNDGERSKSISDLCKKYALNCRKVDVSGTDQAAVKRITQSFTYYGTQKFFVFSPDAVTTAKYAGVLNKVLHRGNSDTIDAIFKLNGVKDEDLKSYLLNL